MVSRPRVLRFHARAKAANKPAFPAMELTEKLLVSLGGWDVMKRARAIKASGAVREAAALLKRAQSPLMLVGDRVGEYGAVDQAVRVALRK